MRNLVYNFHFLVCIHPYGMKHTKYLWFPKRNSLFHFEKPETPFVYSVTYCANSNGVPHALICLEMHPCQTDVICWVWKWELIVSVHRFPGQLLSECNTWRYVCALKTGNATGWKKSPHWVPFEMNVMHYFCHCSCSIERNYWCDVKPKSPQCNWIMC